MKHKPELFPTHINLVLDAGEHAALDTLYDLDPHLRDEQELLHQVIRAGIRALNQVAEKRRKDPDRLTRTQIESSSASTTMVKAPRRIENAAGSSVQERLRERLGEFLLDCEGALSDEDAFRMLLDLGLQHARGETPAEVLARVRKEADLRLVRARVSGQ